VNVLDFRKMKNEGRKISVVTCYDYSSARKVAASNIACKSRCLAQIAERRTMKNQIIRFPIERCRRQSSVGKAELPVIYVPLLFGVTQTNMFMACVRSLATNWVVDDALLAAPAT
jgi:hypothetical protein